MVIENDYNKINRYNNTTITYSYSIIKQVNLLLLQKYTLKLVLITFLYTITVYTLHDKVYIIVFINFIVKEID